VGGREAVGQRDLRKGGVGMPSYFEYKCHGVTLLYSGCCKKDVSNVERGEKERAKWEEGRRSGREDAF
jgi:hypothetical protein